MEYTESEGTHQDQWVQLEALSRNPQESHPKSENTVQTFLEFLLSLLLLLKFFPALCEHIS